MQSNEVQISGELTKATEEYQKAGGAQRASAGTERWFRVGSRCPLMGVSDILLTTPS